MKTTGKKTHHQEGIRIDTRQFFLIAFIAIFCVLTVMRLYFRIITGDIRTGPSSKKEGLSTIVTRILFGAILFFAVALYIGFPERATWTYISLPLYLRVIGVLLGFGALFGLYAVHKELGKYFSSTLVIKKDHKLVKTGPYRFVRHPMYTSYFMLFIAAFLISENWLLGGSGMAIIASLMTLRIGKEESILLEHFGKEYEQYRQTTGMFLPMTHKLVSRKREKEEEIAP